jgi:hypothetical protein
MSCLIFFVSSTICPGVCIVMCSMKEFCNLSKYSLGFWLDWRFASRWAWYSFWVFWGRYYEKEEGQVMWSLEGWPWCGQSRPVAISENSIFLMAHLTPYFCHLREKCLKICPEPVDWAVLCIDKEKGIRVPSDVALTRSTMMRTDTAQPMSDKLVCWWSSYPLVSTAKEEICHM